MRSYNKYRNATVYFFLFFANFANAYSIANSNFKHIDLGNGSQWVWL